MYLFRSGLNNLFLKLKDSSQKKSINGNGMVGMGTGHNGDKSERRQQKRRHAKTATLQNGDNSSQNGDNSSQNGDNH